MSVNASVRARSLAMKESGEVLVNRSFMAPAPVSSSERKSHW